MGAFPRSLVFGAVDFLRGFPLFFQDGHCFTVFALVEQADAAGPGFGRGCVFRFGFADGGSGLFLRADGGGGSEDADRSECDAG